MKIKNYNGVEVSLTLDQSRNSKLTPFGKATLADRYALEGEGPQEIFGRVSGYYSDDSETAQEVYDGMSNLWFMPSTPILSNGGTDRGMPISCFLNAVPDSMDGIDNIYSENIKLASNGGGIGTYWGGVRSIGEKIKGKGETSGIIPFIRVMDSLTLAVSQGSLRRGSAAVYLDMHHPEIMEFLEIRKPGGGDFRRKCLDIHHGVMIDDEFMEAVVNGTSYNLRSPKTGEVIDTIQAREAWFKLLTMRLETGEPYIVFSDTVKRKLGPVYKANGLTVKQSNLCSEIMLHTGIDQLGNNRTAVCCLASVNAHTSDQWFGNRKFLKNFLLFLDNVLTDFINKTEGKPGFESARYSAMRERSIGGGMMGFLSYLQSKSILYASAIGMSQSVRLWKWLKLTANEINIEVAGERGACPDAADHGIPARWANMFAQAPTASISIICGTVSPSHEQFPANVFTQKTLSGSFEVRNFVLEERLRWYADQKFNEFVEDSEEFREGSKEQFLAEVWKSIGKNQGSVQHLPFLSAHDKELFETWEESDQVWAAEYARMRTEWICQGASLNFFLPGDVEKKDLHDLHMKLWRDGVKSAYYLRSKASNRASAAGVEVSQLAGELPQPTVAHEIALVDRGEAPSRYEECLACQ